MTELVFVHGWGFDAHFWDALAPLLAEYPQRCCERGYFGAAPEEFQPSPRAVLIGHSLGFMHGMRQRQNWTAWVAINGFARFVRTREGAGCVRGNVLEDMRARLLADPAKTLKGFYKLIEGEPHAPRGQPNVDRLREGLDELRDGDVGNILSACAARGLTLAARNDVLVPEAASRALAQAKPHTRIQWHDKSDHLLPQTDPAWCARMIKDFMTSF